jgi:dienelactone hydrolase
MRRRAVLSGLLAAVAGAAATGVAIGQQPARAAGKSGESDIMGSTTSSVLRPRPITPYVPVAGTAPGRRFAVGLRDFGFARGADRPLPTRVWYPATGSPGGAVTTAAAPASGPFPLVLFSHGLSSQPNDYAELLTAWARAGFVVAAPLYPHTSHGTADFNSYDIVNQPADASSVLTSMLALNGSADPLSGKLDPGRVAAAGHSAGAITTTGLFSADRDERLKAGVVLAGTDFRSTPFVGAPAGLLFVHGVKDDTVAYAAGHTVFEAVPWSRAMLTITDGGHEIAAGDIPAVTATTTEFLRWSLYGDPEARRRIPVKAAIGAVATLEDQLSEDG